jgi:hypothetical protein
MQLFGSKSLGLACAAVLLGVECLSLQAASVPPPAHVTLNIQIGNAQQTLSLDDLIKRIPSDTVKVFNSSYQRKLAYRGFWIEDIIRTLNVPKKAQIIFICRDGFTTFLPDSAIKKHKWLLAYMETSGQWTPLVQTKETIFPGPWYLIGSKKESFVEYPWPYAVVALRIINSW